MKRLVKLLLSASFLMVLYAGFLSAGNIYATQSAAAKEACQGVSLTGATCDTSTNQTNAMQLNTTISNIVNLLSAIVGIAAVIMIIIAGLRFITSSGNAQGVASARGALIYALVGLAVVALAQVLVHFVLNQANTAT